MPGADRVGRDDRRQDDHRAAARPAPPRALSRCRALDPAPRSTATDPATDPLGLPLEVEDFLTWLRVERGRSPNTVAAYRRDLVAYLELAAAPSGLTLATVDEAAVGRYVAARRAAGRAPASVARGLVAVRSLHRFLADEGILATDPAAEVERPKVPTGLPKPLTEAEVGALLDAVVGDDARARRDRALLEVLYGTGLRISELVGLGLDDLDVDARLLRVFGKGAKERIVPIGRLALVGARRLPGPGGRDVLAPERWARRGDATAIFLNQRRSASVAPGRVADRARATATGSASATGSARTCCATRAPPTCSTTAPTSAACRSCSGTRRSARRRSTRRSRPSGLRSIYDAAHPRPVPGPRGLGLGSLRS